MKVLDKMANFFDVVFDGPPSQGLGRFIEVENEKGEGMKVGEWMQRDDGHWVLRIPDYKDALEEAMRFGGHRLGCAAHRWSGHATGAEGKCDCGYEAFLTKHRSKR